MMWRVRVRVPRRGIDETLIVQQPTHPQAGQKAIAWVREMFNYHGWVQVSVRELTIYQAKVARAPLSDGRGAVWDSRHAPEPAPYDEDDVWGLAAMGGLW